MEWTPISSPDELPDGRYWVTFDVPGVNLQVDDVIVTRSNYTDEGFRHVYEYVVAFMPFVEPEPYTSESCTQCGANVLGFHACESGY